MKKALTHPLRHAGIMALVMTGSTFAHAGAPGVSGETVSERSTVLVKAATQIETPQELSPAEIRNAVSIRMDRLAAQGIEVDRAAVDGIGLEPESDQMVEVLSD